MENSFRYLMVYLFIEIAIAIISLSVGFLCWFWTPNICTDIIGIALDVFVIFSVMLNTIGIIGGMGCLVGKWVFNEKENKRE
jgi:hypothetical protein